jgi:hypothetical protein
MLSARPRVRAAHSLVRTVSRYAPVAGLVIATVFTAGFAANASAPAKVDTSGRAVTAAQRQALDESRHQSVSRSAQRVAQQVTFRPVPTDREFATAPLNIWTQPREQGKRLGLVASGSRIAVTGQHTGHWAQVLLGDRHRLVRWVNADYLAEHKPKPAHDSTGATSSSEGVSTAPCPDGSSTESGLTSSAVLMFRAVCNAFPQLTTYGGYSPHGEHADGHAVDFMISDSGTGQAVADWVQAHAAALHVYDVIWQQHIWTPEQASAGWRYMSDRGSPTANHMDHVHVAVY